MALYARVSTSNGHQDPEMQLRELREYAGRRGWEIAGEYIDHGVSGSKESRPELNRLMTDAHRRRFDAVLVWKIDRFGRSLKHLVNALADLGAYGVAFVSLRDNLDLSTPSGRLMFQIIGAMAEFERALIQERVKAGLRNAQAKGKRLGRPRRVVDASRIAALRAVRGFLAGDLPSDGDWDCHSVPNCFWILKGRRPKLCERRAQGGTTPTPFPCWPCFVAAPMREAILAAPVPWLRISSGRRACLQDRIRCPPLGLISISSYFTPMYSLSTRFSERR